jgi:hypothetical protein
LFFDDKRGPVEVIAVPNPDMELLKPDQYEVIGEKVTHRLAQRPGSYVVRKYVQPLIRRKDPQALSCPPAPVGVIDDSRADVSFLVGRKLSDFITRSGWRCATCFRAQTPSACPSFFQPSGRVSRTPRRPDRRAATRRRAADID